MEKATLTNEITVDTTNTTGTAATLTELVANKAKANIRAVWATGTNGKGHFSLITDNNQKSLEALKTTYPDAKEHEVVALFCSNTMGEIAKVTNTISKAGINIDFLYTTTLDNKTAIILSTNKNKETCDLFQG